MKVVIVLLLILPGMVVVICGERFKPVVPLVIQKHESKTQLKKYILGKDSQSDRFGEGVFDHENHSTKKYSVDAKSVISCVHCHHTDQPLANLRSPLKTSERNVVLTTALLRLPESKPVKSCRACHLQEGDDSAEIPTLAPDVARQYGWPQRLTNEVAFHIECEGCHDKTIAARPVLKGKIPGSHDCFGCHKPVE
jgi:hypothetical protein